MELFKALLNITDTSQDAQITFYLNKAKNAIKNHLFINDEELEQYEQQIVDLAIFYYRNKDFTGIIQGTQGSRSQTMNDGIPRQILDTLPLPRIRVF